MLSRDDWSRAVGFATAGTLFADSQLHGEAHWKAVASQGILLADICGLGNEGRAVGALFGLFHDSRRENDDHDPEHGRRAARAFTQWAMSSAISDELHDALVQSMILHDTGQVTDDRIVGIGWDADRSTLERVGIDPDPRFFSCVPEGYFKEYVAAGRSVTSAPPDWDEIYDRAFGPAAQAPKATLLARLSRRWRWRPTA